jgi:single-strand DNA-binding protein
MARGLNRIMIIGFVEREPEIRLSADGKPVASFTVSTSCQWTTSAGEKHDATEWFNIVAWDDLAEAAKAQLHEGQRIYAEGHLQTRSWDDTNGDRHVRCEVVAGRLIPMGDREAITIPDAESSSTDSAQLCLNRAMVIGNLGRDPEMRYTPEGQAVTTFALAATRSWTLPQGGRGDSTEWFNIVAWGSLAEICNQYLAKGRRVYVEGELRTRGWEQPDGAKHFRSELIASEMIMLGPRPKTWPAEREPNQLGDEPPF